MEKTNKAKKTSWFKELKAEFNRIIWPTKERIAKETADIIMEELRPYGVMVVIEAEHMCMTMRGVKKPGSKTVTSAVRGVFAKDIATRTEAMNLILMK